MQYILQFLGNKIDNFQMKLCDIFLYLHQTQIVGTAGLELPHQDCSHEYPHFMFWNKDNVYTVDSEIFA